MSVAQWNNKDITLLDLLDRALDKGVFLWGEITISVADVDLIYLGLKVILCSIETAERMKQVARDPENLELRSVERTAK